MNEQSPFSKFLDAGYRYLVPIIPPDAALHQSSKIKPHSRGKAPGVRCEDGTWKGVALWTKTEPTTQEELASWAATGAGVGIRTGFGVVGLDIDTTDKAWADTVEALAREMLGPAPVRVGNAPKRLMPYRTVEDVSFKCVTFDDGTKFEKRKAPRVELLTRGKQFVAHGVHPGTGRPYSWPGALVPADKLTTVTAEQWGAFFTELARILPATKLADFDREHTHDVPQEALKCSDPEWLRAVVSSIPNNDDFEAYEDYIRVAAAIRGAAQDYPEDGCEIFLDWCSRWTLGDNDPDEAERDYWSLRPPFRRGLTYLTDKARKYDPDGHMQRLADKFFAPLPDDEPNPFEEAAHREAQEQQAKHDASRFRFQSIMDAADTALSNGLTPIIKGLLDKGTIAVMYGDSNVGKTFVALDMAYHVWQGLPYSGLKTTRGNVVYVAAEGGLGIKRRARALITERRPEPRHGFDILAQSINLFDPQADLKPFIEAVRALGTNPSLIVVDTLARVMVGGDENDNNDMGVLVNNLSAIRDAIGCAVLIVHHTGKDKARGARGGYALICNTDTVMELQAGKTADGRNGGTITTNKQRDMGKDIELSYVLRTIHLGFDDDGDIITSAIAEVCDATADTEGRVLKEATPAEEAVLDAIHTLLAVTKAHGVAVADINKALGKTDRSAETTRTHLRRLKDKGHIVLVEHGKWGLKPVQNACTGLRTGKITESDPVQAGTKSGTKENGGNAGVFA